MENLIFVLAATAFASVCVLPCAAQEEQYRERQVLDPDSDAWVSEPADVVDAPSGALGQARLLLVEGRSRKARKLLAKWTEQNPEHERYYEGVYLLGEAYFERGDYWKAYEQYEEVAENTAGELFHKALQRETDVARAFLSGEPRIVWRIMRLPAYDDGIEILDRVWERAPGTRLGEEAWKLKADYFFATGDMDLAQDEYVGLTREYPNGKYLPLAMMRAAEAAEAAFPGILFDDRALAEAEERYRQVEAAFPTVARRENVAVRMEGIREQRAEKDLAVGKWYERTRQPGAAAYYYRLVVDEHPDSLAAQEARVRLQAMGIESGSPE